MTACYLESCATFIYHRASHEPLHAPDAAHVNGSTLDIAGHLTEITMSTEVAAQESADYTQDLVLDYRAAVSLEEAVRRTVGWEQFRGDDLRVQSWSNPLI